MLLRFKMVEAALNHRAVEVKMPASRPSEYFGEKVFGRAVMRKYLDKAVESEKCERILRAAMQAPTGHNAQDFEFIVVTDEAMRAHLSLLGEIGIDQLNDMKNIPPQNYNYNPSVFVPVNYEAYEEGSDDRNESFSSTLQKEENDRLRY